MNVLGLALTVFFGLLSVILTLILYFRGRRKRLTFTWELTELQTRRHPDIAILFKDKPVENLSRLRVAMWNSGNQEIRHSDIPLGGHPTIDLSSAVILSVAHLDASAKTPAPKLGDKAISLDFEYLNPNDWMVLDILCELDRSKTLSPHFSASLIGGMPADSREFEKPGRLGGFIAPLIAFGLLGFAGVYFWATSLPMWAHKLSTGGVELQIVPALVSLVLILLVIIGWFALLGEARRSYKASRLPRGAREVFKS